MRTVSECCKDANVLVDNVSKLVTAQGNDRSSNPHLECAQNLLKRAVDELEFASAAEPRAQEQSEHEADGF